MSSIVAFTYKTVVLQAAIIDRDNQIQVMKHKHEQ